MRSKGIFRLILVSLVIFSFLFGTSTGIQDVDADLTRTLDLNPTSPELCSSDSLFEIKPEVVSPLSTSNKECANSIQEDSGKSQTSSPEDQNSIRFGNGVITIQFDSSFPVAYQAYVNDLFLDLYAPSVNLFGAPAFSRTVTLLYNSSSGPCCYYNNNIRMGILPNISLPYSPDSPNDPYFDHYFLYALLWAFQDPIEVSLPFDWAGAAMITVGTELISLYVNQQGIRNMPSDPSRILLDYDTINNMDSEILGGHT